MPSPNINCNLSPNEQWKDGINKAYESVKATAQKCAKNKSGGCQVDAWNKWDEEIRTTVNAFNDYLSATTPNFRSLDWRYIKAMLWTESGAKDKAWDSRPMQFGNRGDKGKVELLSPDPIKKIEYELIVPKKYRTNLDTGAHNIHQGVAYLFKKLANFDFKLIYDPDPTTYFITVKQGDTLAKIAKANNTDIEILKNMNPEVVNPLNLKPNMKLKYRKGARKRVITGWKDISTMSTAKNYNGNGDPTYCARLNYVLQLLRKDK